MKIEHTVPTSLQKTYDENLKHTKIKSKKKKQIHPKARNLSLF